jgi:O-antigen/teichoic acid export membrane protein
MKSKSIDISGNLKSFFSDSAIYTLLNLLNKAVPFLMLPIIIRIVNTEEYGIYSLFITLETLLIPIVSLNTHSALSSHYFQDDLNLNQYLSSIIYFLLLTTLFFGVISIFIPQNFAAIIGLEKKIIIMAMLTAGINGLFNLVSTLFRLQRKPWIYGLFTIGNSVFLLLGVILFLIWLKPDSDSLVLGRVASFAVFTLLTIIMLRNFKLLSLIFKKKLIENILAFSLPTIVFSLSAFVFSASDRFLIQHYLGTEAVGHYSAIYQVASLISVLGMSLNAAWIPWLFENLKKKDSVTDIIIVKISYGLMIGFLGCGLLFCMLFINISKTILTAEYYPFIKTGIPIIIGFVFQVLYFIVSPYISFVEKTKYLAYGGIGVAIINVTLNLFLIPTLGIIGAAYSNCISWICLFIYSSYCSSRVYPMPWFNLGFRV